MTESRPLTHIKEPWRNEAWCRAAFPSPTVYQFTYEAVLACDYQRYADEPWCPDCEYKAILYRRSQRRLWAQERKAE